MGLVDSDLQYLKVGPIVHSRWLTLGCRILRYYVSVDEPTLLKLGNSDEVLSSSLLSKLV